MNELSLGAFGLIIGLIIGMDASLIGNFTTYVASQYGNKHSRKQIIGRSITTIVYMIMLCVIGILVAAALTEKLTLRHENWILIGIVTLAIFYGCLLVWQYFWPGTPLPYNHHKRLAHQSVTKRRSNLQPITIAFTQVYSIWPLLIICSCLLAMLGMIYNILPLFWSIFLAIGIATPSYAILALMSNGTKASHLMTWLHGIRATTRLYSGLLIILLTWFILYGVIGAVK